MPGPTLADVLPTSNHIGPGFNRLRPDSAKLASNLAGVGPKLVAQFEPSWARIPPTSTGLGQTRLQIGRCRAKVDRTGCGPNATDVDRIRSTLAGGRPKIGEAGTSRENVNPVETRCVSATWRVHAGVAAAQARNPSDNLAPRPRPNIDAVSRNVLSPPMTMCIAPAITTMNATTNRVQHAKGRSGRNSGHLGISGTPPSARRSSAVGEWRSCRWGSLEHKA